MFLHNKDSGKSDVELMRLYKADRKLEWLGALYMRYAPMVYGVCLKYLKDREEARDAVMQIHEKLITSLFQHDVDNFRSWIYVNAKNHCLMQLRVKKGHIREEISIAFMENGLSQHPEEDILIEKDNERLENCIRALAEPQQRCIILFYLEEKCYKEISTSTGFDARQVKSYIQNGKRNLKSCMEQNG